MHKRVDILLTEIQITLERAGYWQTVAPEPERLISQQPFSLDTLSFLEWLQWIYIARLRALLDAEGTLPSGAKVLPYAEEALNARGESIPGLLTLIEQLDDVLSSS